MTQRLTLRGLLFAATLALLAGSFQARAQLVIDVTTSAGKQVPVAILPFANEDGAPQNITPVVSGNLARTGLFRIVNLTGVSKLPTEPSEVNFVDWSSRGTEALVIGAITPLPDGRYEVRFRLFDVAKQSQATSFSYTVGAAQLRATAHKISDEIYQKLIGERGIFSTKVAYVLKRGPRFELQVADADGFNPQTVLSSLEPIGGPKWSSPQAKVRPEQGLLGLRKAMGVFANLRPVSVHPALRGASTLKPEVLEGVDLVFVRELTGGIYFGEKARTADSASDLCTYTVAEVERIVRVAARLARARRGRLASIDKANVLETSRLWREVTTRVIKEEFPDVQLEHMLVDSAAMHLVRRPRDFDVAVTENMFGDILTDEASMLAGSLGLLPSASLGEGTRGLFEPIHGSAPDIAGKGIANPYGTILSVALLLRHSLGLEAEARAIEQAVSDAIVAGVLTADLAPPGKAVDTRTAGAAVVSRLG